jgi:adenosylcobinamide kinase/adenosylcobinamide-phosphate guanylyltransferase
VRTLVLGGIRSGKSRWAESAIATSVGHAYPVQYLATGAASDAAWSQRVAEHRGRRPKHWSTIETQDVATQLRTTAATATLLDDVGGWLTAAMDRRDAWNSGTVTADVDDLIAAVSTFGSTLVIVSPEVGLTVLPATQAGRRFADELGTLNQRLADLCDQVVLVVAGQAVPVKRLSISESEI